MQTKRILIALWLSLGLWPAWVVSGQGQKEKAEPAAPKTLLKLPVAVTGADEQFWRDGKRDSFKVFVEEKEVPLKSFQGPRTPTIILLVFDTVADLAVVEQARTALDGALDGLAENHWLAVMQAQDGLAVLQEPTPQRALIREKIQTVKVNGKAGLLDTLEPVSKLATGMMQKAGVRVCIFYVTDSGIGNYRADYLNPVINASDSGDLSRRFSDRAVQERMSRLGEELAGYTIPLFILHLSYRSDTLNLAYQSGLERIAAASGGIAMFCRTQNEIPTATQAIFERIQSTYFLGIEPPNVKRRTLKLRVTAQDSAGESLPRVQYANQLNLRKK